MTSPVADVGPARQTLTPPALELTPSPLVALNRAVAVTMRDGPAAGLDLIEEFHDAPELRHYHLLPAARADLLTRAG